MQARDPKHAKGVDVSWYQGVIDWPKVKEAGYSFSISKVTEGSTITDANYAANISGAKSAGMLVGGYHFLHARTPQEAISEAQFFLRRLSEIGGHKLLDIPAVVDIEVPYLTIPAIRAWIDFVYETTKKKPIIYTNAQYLDKYLTGPEFRDCKLWYAMYGSNQPANRSGWNEWMFYQYTDQGQIPGINSYVDLNEYMGSVEDLFGYKMSQSAADTFIIFCKYQYEMAVSDEDRKKWAAHAKEARLAAGLAEDYEPAGY